MTTALEKPDMNTEELLAGQTITPAEEEQNSVQSTSRLSREEIIDSLRKTWNYNQEIRRLHSRLAMKRRPFM